MDVDKKLLEQLGITFVQEAGGIAEFTLDVNGLKILLSENHASPVVTVMPVYRVGSRNEAVGYTGATHILEHMMFKSVRDGRTGQVYDVPGMLRPMGGVRNATTWFDRTNYFECVPKQYLERCIAAESDRMRNLLINEDEKASEMTVVRNELERGQNDPTRVMLLQMYAAAFREHPYHHPTIGWVSDVEGITIDRLKAFYDQFYWPNNTTLLVMGDIDPAETLAMIVKYYGAIPRSAHEIPTVYTVEPKQEGERRITVRRAGDAPRVVVAFHIPEAAHADTYPLAALASILGGGRKSSRLYKALVDTKLAAQAFVWHFKQRDPGLFMVFATVAPGVEPAAVEKAILDELEALKTEPVTDDELRRAKTATAKVNALKAADPMQLADELAEAEATAGWRSHVDFDANLGKVTPQDVQRVVSTYVDADNRTVGYFIPKRSQPKAVAPAAATAAGAQSKPEKASFAARTRRTTLANGMTVLVLPTPGTGVVGVCGQLRASDSHMVDRTLVPSLAALLLTAGTQTRSAQNISDTLEEMGTGLQFATDEFGLNFRTQVVPADFPSMLELIGDCLRNPSYPESELATTRMRWLSNFDRKASDTEEMAKIAFTREVYPEGSVFREKLPSEQAEEINGLTVEDLKAFHKDYISPSGMILTIAGDLDADATVAAVEAAFGTWTGPQVAPATVAGVELPAERKRLEVQLADKANASIVIGHPSTLVRTAEDFFSARLACAALGGDTISARLGKKVRKEAGLTYGIYSMFSDPRKGAGPFIIQLSVNPKNIDQALALVDEVVGNALREGISEAEINQESSSAVGTFFVQLRRCDALASTITQFESLGLGLEQMDRYEEIVSSVTKETADAALRKYVRPGSFITAIAGTLS